MSVWQRKRTQLLRTYMRIFHWLDLKQLNAIHRYRTEEFGSGSANMLNRHPESIPGKILYPAVTGQG